MTGTSIHQFAAVSREGADDSYHRGSTLVFFDDPPEAYAELVAIIPAFIKLQYLVQNGVPAV